MVSAVVAGAGLAPAAQAAAPVNVVSPLISGNARTGQTLKTTQGEWEGDPTAFFYSWLRCDPTGAACVPVPGATEPKYDLTEADLGSRIRVEVVAQNADGASPASRSAATAVVKVPVPTVIAKPTVAGIPREGEVLTGVPGQWSGSPTSYSFDWKRCFAGKCTGVPGATSQTYRLGAGDIGTRLRVRVRATNAGGRSAASSSLSTATVQPAGAGFALGRPSQDRKRGLARLRVSVPSAGTLTLAQTGKVRGESRRAAGPRTLKLTVRARGRAKTRLNRRGKTRVRVHISFDPDGGAPVMKSRRVVLRKR
jgi:hypothetical protein